MSSPPPKETWGPLDPELSSFARRLSNASLVESLELLALRAKVVPMAPRWRALLAEVCRRLDPPRVDVDAYFTEPIFYGDVSCLDLRARVRAQLQEAEELTGGLQQPRMSTEEPATADELEHEAALGRRRDELLRSVVIALGGKRILNGP